MSTLKKETCLLFTLLASSSTVIAQDTRSAAMGGVGVASSHYSLAPLHNPALLDSGKYQRNAALTLPTVSVSGQDDDDLISSIDHFNEIYESGDITSVTQNDWVDALNNIKNKSLAMEAQAGVVLAIPNNLVSLALFSKANFDGLAYSDINQDDYTIDPNQGGEQLKSTVTGVVGGTVDFGVSLARELGYGVTLGVSPKFQRIFALQYKDRLDNYDSSDYDGSESFETKNVFNLDLGVAYQATDDLRVGVSVIDAISHTLTTNAPVAKSAIGERSVYSVEPQYKIGADYDISPALSVAVDVDMNKRKPFKNIDYDTQFAHIGTEYVVDKWLSFRGGYKRSLTDFAVDQFSLGLGVNILNAVGFDLAAMYGNHNNLGASAQISFRL